MLALRKVLLNACPVNLVRKLGSKWRFGKGSYQFMDGKSDEMSSSPCESRFHHPSHSPRFIIVWMLWYVGVWILRPSIFKPIVRGEERHGPKKTHVIRHRPNIWRSLVIVLHSDIFICQHY